MSRRLALFRAVNVGGRTVKMGELRSLFEDIGLGPATTLQAAGSVVFQGEGASEDLEASLEAACLDRMGLATSVFVRDTMQWNGIIAANPFSDAAMREPSRLVVMPLKRPGDVAGARALEAAGQAGEGVAVMGRCAYIYYPLGVGVSKITLRRIESGLGSPGTARNWNTVLKLQALMAD